MRLGWHYPFKLEIARKTRINYTNGVEQIPFTELGELALVNYYWRLFKVSWCLQVLGPTPGGFDFLFFFDIHVNCEVIWGIKVHYKGLSGDLTFLIDHISLFCFVQYTQGELKQVIFIGNESKKNILLPEQRAKVYSKLAHLLSFFFRKNKKSLCKQNVNPFNFLFLSKTARSLVESVYKTPSVMKCSIRVDYYCFYLEYIFLLIWSWTISILVGKRLRHQIFPSFCMILAKLVNVEASARLKYVLECLVLSSVLVGKFGNRKEIRVLTFRALALGKFQPFV